MTSVLFGCYGLKISTLMKIYVDTSVFGGCFDQEFEMWSNRLMERFRIGQYTAVISEVSEFELKYAPSHVKRILEGIPLTYLEVAKLADKAKQKKLLLKGRYISILQVKVSMLFLQDYCGCIPVFIPSFH